MRGGDFMAETMAVAKYFNKLYVMKHGSNMDELKMHKMMYFSQRESLMISGNPLFNDDFQAWRLGPVLLDVRKEYMTGEPFSGDYGDLDESERELVESVFNRYDSYSSWSLSTLSHSEYSWLQARQGLSYEDPGKEKMTLSAMKVDAKKEFLRRKGVVLS